MKYNGKLLQRSSYVDVIPNLCQNALQLNRKTESEILNLFPLKVTKIYDADLNYISNSSGESGQIYFPSRIDLSKNFLLIDKIVITYFSCSADRYGTTYYIGMGQNNYNSGHGFTISVGANSTVTYTNTYSAITFDSFWNQGSGMKTDTKTTVVNTAGKEITVNNMISTGESTEYIYYTYQQNTTIKGHVTMYVVSV